MKVPYLNSIEEAGLDEQTLAVVCSLVSAIKKAAAAKIFPVQAYAIAVTTEGMAMIDLANANNSETAAEIIRKTCQHISAKTVMLVTEAWHLEAPHEVGKYGHISKHPKAKEVIHISIETAANTVVGTATIKKKKIGVKKPTGELGEFKWLVCELMKRDEAVFGELLPKQNNLF
ncbi:hypothetical protein WJ968_32750 [Achromobacter xylosoxidans]